MKFLSVTVGGFKNVVRTTIELDGIVPLVARNNYGKSNLLQAIEFGFEFLGMSERQRQFSVADERSMPLTFANKDENFHFEVEFDDPSLGEYRSVRYGFEFSWNRGDETEDGGRIVDEWLELASAPNKRKSSYIKRQTNEYRAAYRPRTYETFKLDKLQLYADVFRSEGSIDIAAPLRAVRRLGLNPIRYIDPRSEHVLRMNPFVLTGPYISAVTQRVELPELLHQIQTNDPDAFEEFLENVYTLFPSFNLFQVERLSPQDEEMKVLAKVIGNVSKKEGEQAVTLRDPLYNIVVVDKNLSRPVELTEMSNGTGRVVLLLAYAAIAAKEPGQILGVEEIETSIHPRLIGDLLAAIEQGRGDASYIVTSHSPLMTQYFDFSKIYVGVPNEEGLAVFRKLSKRGLIRLNNGALDFGMSRGDFLFHLLSDESVEDPLGPYLAAVDGDAR